MANIDKELKDIKNAVYGREVRGSIHDGIDKINKESEESKGKADEAHEVMESIMEEGFDNAALEANFKKKLDNKISNLQPEWTQFKEDTETQLAEEAKQRFYSSLTSHKEPAFMVSIVDDDGKIGFYTDYLPLIREYNIPVTSAMITSRIGAPNYMTEAHLKECHAAGAEIMSHTHWHNINKQPRDMSEKELFDDFTKTRKIMQDLGFNYRGLVQPFGTYTDKVLNVARQVFDYNIGTANKGNNIITPPFSNFELLRRTGERHSFEQIKVDIDRARDANGWIILTTHVDQGYGWTEEKTRQIIEYVHSQGGRFVTTLEGFNAHGNLMEIDNKIITAKGQFFGEDFAYLGRNALTPDDTPRNPLLYQRKTVTDITTSGADGFPENVNRQLVTVAYQRRSAYQYYYVHNSYRAFLRRWYDTMDRWGNWSLVQDRVMYYPADRNDFNANTPRANFRNGETISTITSNDDLTGTPQGRPGLLTTYIIPSGRIRHHYQEFQDYSNGSIFRRQGTGTTDNGWDAWKTIFEGD